MLAEAIMIVGNKSNVSIGDRFGQLTIKHLFYGYDGHTNKLAAICVCDCGNESEVRVNSLKRGNTTSCGCFNKQRIKESKITHGFRRHPLYIVWRNMMTRCYKTNNKSYKYYGGRGIIVSEEFHDLGTFINWCLNNGWEKGLTIDRRNNNGNYQMDNLRMVTIVEQANNKRNNRIFIYNGVTKTIAEWSRDPICQVSYKILLQRINKQGWSFEKALLTPLRSKRKIIKLQ